MKYNGSSKLQSTTLQVLGYSVLHCKYLDFSVLNCKYYSAQYYTALYYTTLYLKQLHCTTIQCTGLHYPLILMFCSLPSVVSGVHLTPAAGWRTDQLCYRMERIKCWQIPLKTHILIRGITECKGKLNILCRLYLFLTETV